MLGADRPELAGGLDHDLREVARLARHDARDVGARQQQQVGDQPAHPLGGAQRRAGRLALVAVQRLGEQLEVGEHAGQRRAQLVRGVGHEVALAREHRLGLAAGRVELAEHPLQRARELRDLVVGLRLGACGATGRACARSRRRSRSARRSAPSRGARSRCPASSASTVPASTPSSRNSSTRAIVASGRRRGGRTGRSAARRARPSPQHHDRVADHAVAVDGWRFGTGGPSAGALAGYCAITLPVEVRARGSRRARRRRDEVVSGGLIAKVPRVGSTVDLQLGGEAGARCR